MSISVIRCIDSAEWDSVLTRCSDYDFYHLPSYHCFHERNGHGRGILIVYQEGEKLVAIPLLIRSLSEVEGIQGPLANWNDATSVYGYAGPITNCNWHHDMAFFNRFSKSLAEALHELRIISVFSRLHPLLGNEAALSMGEIRWCGYTVSIDLLQSLEMQRRKYRKDHKYSINKAKRSGVTGHHDRDWKYYDDFLQLYRATMIRVKASEMYYFDRQYFDGLRGALGSKLHLFVAKLGDDILSAGLFTLVQGIVQFHLSGSRLEQMKLAPSKVMLDKVRIWATAQGARVFHLGGGVGAKEDSVYEFKSGFSDRRHRFAVWNWILEEKLYALAVEQRRAWLRGKGQDLVSDGFFPLYRATPAIPETNGTKWQFNNTSLCPALT